MKGLKMIRAFGLLLFVVLGCTVTIGCGGDGKPEPLTPDQEQQLEQQLHEAQQSEAASGMPGEE